MREHRLLHGRLCLKWDQMLRRDCHPLPSALEKTCHSQVVAVRKLWKPRALVGAAAPEGRNALQKRITCVQTRMVQVMRSLLSEWDCVCSAESVHVDFRGPDARGKGCVYLPARRMVAEEAALM